MPASLHESFRFARGAKLARNRCVLAAMTNQQSNADASLGEDELRWLLARASFGVVTTCAAHVARDGQGWAGELGVFDDALLPGLTRLASSLRAAGTLSLCQHFHGGMRAPSRLTGQAPFSASAVEVDITKGEAARAATEADIERTIQAFADAARRTEQAGFDGVELHGAHGYLLAQFLGKKTNRRSDGWGGSLEKRARLLREVYRAARAVTGADFLIGVRFSPELEDIGIDLDESLELVRMLESDGVDFLHVSNGDSFRPPRARPESERRLTAHVRAVLADATPLIATGAVWTRDDAETVLRDGADFVGVARAAIGNADWARAVEDAAWQAARPPYSVAHLRDQGLGEAFIAYMRRWPDFVVD